jgi:hypothetical protein
MSGLVDEQSKLHRIIRRGSHIKVRSLYSPQQLMAASKFRQLDGISSIDCDINENESVQDIKFDKLSLRFLAKPSLEEGFLKWSLNRSQGTVARSLLLFTIVRIAEYLYHRYLSGFGVSVANWVGYSVVWLTVWDFFLFHVKRARQKITIMWILNVVGCGGMISLSMLSICLDPEFRTVTVAFNATLLLAATPDLLCLRFVQVLLVALECVLAISITFAVRSNLGNEPTGLALAFFALAAIATLQSARRREYAERQEFIALISLRIQFRDRYALANRLLPPSVASKVIEGINVIATSFSRPVFIAMFGCVIFLAPVTFLGIDDFENIVSTSNGIFSVKLVNHLFSRIDELITSFAHVIKIEAISEIYQVAAGDFEQESVPIQVR